MRKHWKAVLAALVLLPIMTTVNAQTSPPPLAPPGGETPSPPTPSPPEVPGVQVVEQEAEAGETVATGTVEEVNAANPVVVAVTVSQGGTVTIQQVPLNEDVETLLPDGYSFVGQQFLIEAPPATPEDPLEIVFAFHRSLLPDPDAPAQGVQVFRNGVEVVDCAGRVGVAEPDPCVDTRGEDGDIVSITVLTSQASTWNFGQASESAATSTTELEQAASQAQPEESEDDGFFTGWVTAWAAGVLIALGALLAVFAIRRRSR